MLDQYYTKDHIAQQCWDNLSNIITNLNKNIDDYLFIEPSAGTGSFYNIIPTNNKIGFDIDPKHDEVMKQDFLSYLGFWDLSKPIITIGNPPFGKRGKLAVEFINHAALFSDIIAFILPKGMNNWRCQHKINSSFKLIDRLELEPESFYLPDTQSYNIKSEFQTWAIGNIKPYKDLRLKCEPTRIHKDFKLLRYNNTPETLNVFDHNFDLAVPCQGWQDYSRRETKSKCCERTKQWMLFFAQDKNVLERLNNINYEQLATKNTTVIPGFGKPEVIAEYNRLYQNV